jgi:predicted phosphodiesterase
LAKITKYGIIHPNLACDEIALSVILYYIAQGPRKGYAMRYLIISDIHANIAAFEAVLEDAGDFTKIWCLGDLVGYGPDPNECIEKLRMFDHLCVAGNHDWAVLGRLDLEDFNPDAQRASLWTRDQLTRDNCAYLESLPTTLIEEGFTLVHGSPRQPVWEYVLYPSVARPNFNHFGTQFCFIGHTHVPVVFQLVLQEFGEYSELIQPSPNEPIPFGEYRLMINSGSVGQPRDGNPCASYAILDIEHHTIEYRRISYPIEKTQHRMEKAGLPDRLIGRLAFGW